MRKIEKETIRDDAANRQSYQAGDAEHGGPDQTSLHRRGVVIPDEHPRQKCAHCTRIEVHCSALAPEAMIHRTVGIDRTFAQGRLKPQFSR